MKRDIDPLQEREISIQNDEDNPLFGDFAERFIKNHVKKKLAQSTAAEYERQIRKYFIPAWGKRKVADIQRKQIVKLVEKLSDNTPIMANRALATVKKMFSYAVSVGLTEFNPAAGIERPGKETPRDRVLSMDEIVIMFRMLEDYGNRDTSEILQLITLTAQRPGEVREMHLSQFKEDADGLWFQLKAGDTKNSEPTRIFLNDMAAQIIKTRVSDLGLTHYIFPAETKSGFMRKDNLVDRVQRIQPLMQESGVARFTAHDLRRSAATGLARLGYGSIVDDILNHKQQGITRRVYDLYSRAPEIKRALTAWGEAIERAIDGNQADVIEIKGGKG
ncbi:MAG: tyrosine-type recombinase/integrase [Pseudomonadota bacterium]|nr:tyrosine-type recombinase/integrase [Pseudomonadota bacterium]